MPKPQLSLFENTECKVCGCKVDNNQVTCVECTEAWMEYYLNKERLNDKNIKKE